MDLLISFQWGRFYPMLHEARRILKQLGDDQPQIEWTSVDGIAVAHTALDNREVITRCRELQHNKEARFEFAVKWVPVDFWCETDLDAMKQVIQEKVCPRIKPNECWAMTIKRRRWDRYHKADIIAYLAPSIDRKVDLSNPDKIVWIDVVGAYTAIAVLKPDEIFSAILE